ncbi:MAG: hypothetical protein HC880_02170 [Bacteroidia bacterium]|nr:hypothetical protein [Bacteroidia bacterium]
MIDIVTTSFPDVLTITASAQVSYNTLATWNDQFVSATRSNTDWLGYDDGSRSIPAGIDPDCISCIPSFDELFTNLTGAAPLLREATTAFNNNFDPIRDSRPLTTAFCLSRQSEPAWQVPLRLPSQPFVHKRI